MEINGYEKRSCNTNTFIHLRIAPLCRCARQKHFSSNWHDFSLTLFTCVYSALQKVRRFLRPSRKGKFLSAWLISPKTLDTGATVTNLTDERLVSRETKFSCHEESKRGTFGSKRADEGIITTVERSKADASAVSPSSIALTKFKHSKHRLRYLHGGKLSHMNSFDVKFTGFVVNRPFSNSHGWTGSSMKWRLMRANLVKCKLICPH